MRMSLLLAAAAAQIMSPLGYVQAQSDVPPAPRTMRQPPCPVKAWRHGPRGDTTIELDVNQQGRVRAVTIKQSSGNPRLDLAAMDYAKQRWLFFPARRDGRAVSGTIRETVSWCRAIS